MSETDVLKPLNSRQRQFVINLVAGMSQTQAYIKAGYDDSGAGQSALTLLNSTKVKTAYQALIERRDQKALQTIEDTIASPLEVKQILSKLLRSNVKNHLNEHGEPELGEDAVAVKEYSTRRRLDSEGNPIVSKEIKLESKLEAARELAKIHGMYAPSKQMIAQKIQFEVVHIDRHKPGEE